MAVDIVIRSYWKDFEWLVYCLKSIRRYCTGFRQVILVIPQKSEPWLSRYGIRNDDKQIVLCPDYADDYLGQQVTKTYADTLTDADFICHVDSDCIFRRPTSAAELAPSGKPKVYFCLLSELPPHWPWTQPTEEFLGRRPSYDFMQSPPFVFPRWLYGHVRTWCRETKGVELAEWIRSRPERGFSEFNALSAFALERFPDKFWWIEASKMGDNEATCAWHWSWGGIDEAGRNAIIETLRGDQ